MHPALIGPAPTPQGTFQVYELATLRPAEARTLVGRRALYRVQFDSLPESFGRRTLYDAAGIDDAHRTVWLEGDHEVERDVLTVEATLMVFWHIPWTPENGRAIPGFYQMRLTHAVVR